MSPDTSANKDGDGADDRQSKLTAVPLEREQLRDDPSPVESESVDDGDAAEIEVLTIFRRRMAGARRLPRRERALARRAALDWLRSALMALREQRAYRRSKPQRRNPLQTYWPRAPTPR